VAGTGPAVPASGRLTGAAIPDTEARCRTLPRFRGSSSRCPAGYERERHTGPVQLETRRLRLRPLLRSDEPEIAVLPFTRPSIRDVALKLVREGASEQEWEQRGYGPFAVLERDGGRFLGRVGLMYRAPFGETELSWILREDAQGYGYATEAAAAVLDWGLRTFDLPYITAMIRPDNRPSLRVAERLGLMPLRDDVLRDEQLTVYHATRRDTATGSIDR